MNRQLTQAAVAIIGILGLVAAAIITLFVPDLGDERNLLLGGLIGVTSSSGAWLFRLNGHAVPPPPASPTPGADSEPSR